jgi:hypothetical protein
MFLLKQECVETVDKRKTKEKEEKYNSRKMKKKMQSKQNLYWNITCRGCSGQTWSNACLLHNHENTTHGLQKILLCIADIAFLNTFTPNETDERDM